LVSGPWQKQKPAADDNEKWVVALPDDYPVAMAAVLAMIYRQWYKLTPRYSYFVSRIEVMWRIVSAAEKYDVANLLWDRKIDWPPQAYPHSTCSIPDNEYAHVIALKQLAILWQLGAVGLVEYTVREYINKLPQATVSALLALAEDAPRFGLPISLRGLIRVVMKGRNEAIQSALDFFHRALADP
jgi:hypothetical protein